MTGYLWTDGDGHSDFQPASAFDSPANGWRAEYDAERDEWLVWTPYTNTVRRYQRYPR